MTTYKVVILLLMILLLCGLDEVFSKDGTETNIIDLSDHHSSLKTGTSENYRVRSVLILHHQKDL